MQYSYSQFFRDIYRYVKPYKLNFFLAFFFRLTSDLAHLYPAWALSRIIYLISLEKTDDLFRSIVQIVVIWFVLIQYKSIGREIAKYLGFQVAERAGLDLYKDCLRHMFRLDFAWHELEDSGNKFKRITRGRDGMYEIIRNIFAVFIEVAVNTIGIVFIFSQQDTSIAVGLVIFMITFYLLGVTLLKKATYYEKSSSKKDEDVGGITFEALNNIRTIKALSIDRRIVHIIVEKIAVLFTDIKQRIFWYRVQNGALNVYYHVFEISVVGFILYGIWQGNSPVSLLVLFVALFQRVGDSLWEMTEITQQVVVAKIWVGRTMSILGTKAEIEHPKRLETQQNFPENWEQITIKNVTFTYQTEGVLKNMSLSIKRGEKIGIVGISGSGKTTLFKLLMDLYETYEGDIVIDDISLKNMRRESYINHVSVVLQDTELFNMSLKENIMITAGPGKKEDEERLNEVVKTSHLEDVIAKLSQGVDTLVGEKGIRLSGGQRQRVGIARALYRKPDILLMDEATSHLDVHSEKQIQQALHDAFGKCTAIVIAHRLSTIREMDRIIVMQEGEIKEEGTFKQLLAKKGIFMKMWEEQTL
ncbi:MAG: ABC transporter ATP-binding protein/permease [Candidatus Roizmanbacteria bacterium]|nr:ABC transporter ATP-binding protein/permease [Candidatus Roizmanbacteria bacterium]